MHQHSSDLYTMYKILAQSHQTQTPPDHFPEPTSSIPSQYLHEAVFAGDSFWDLEAAYGLLDGVVRTATGYCGGTLHKPTHKQVSEGQTGHTETLIVIFDERKVSYKSLCDHFWGTHDPTSKEYLNFGIETHYRSAIFYTDDDQRKQAQQSKIRRQMKLNKRIVTKIVRLESEFYLAENHNQKYYLQRNYIRVCEVLSLRSTEQFVASHIASKLNGILFLNGSKHVEYLKQFAEINELSKHTMLVCEALLRDMDRSNADQQLNEDSSRTFWIEKA